MINKTIHYCWFGRGEKSELIKNCIDSWKKHLVDYEIIEWNEDNFDVNCNQFVKEAYENRKFAFVSDFARLKVLYENGGIYLDTDVEIIKPFSEKMLKAKAITGFEMNDFVQTAVMACEKNYALFGNLLQYYDDKKFILDDGSFNSIPNPQIITDELDKRGLKHDNTFQVIDGLAVYPEEFFSPLEDSTGIMKKTENTVAIHWFAKTWWEKDKIKKYNRAKLFYKILGKKNVQKISRFKHRLAGK